MPFKTRIGKDGKKIIGYYDDKSRTRKTIEIDTREDISTMISIIYHEISHLVVAYFALDAECVKKIKEAMGEEGQYKFKKVTEDEEEKICKDIERQSKKCFKKYLEKV